MVACGRGKGRQVGLCPLWDAAWARAGPTPRSSYDWAREGADMNGHVWDDRRRALVLGIAGVIAAGLALPIRPSRAAILIVDTLIDEDDGVDVGGVSLRDAINVANSNSEADTIIFGVTGTIRLADYLPSILSEMTIAGPGTEKLSISGEGACAILLAAGADLTITDLTLSDGLARGGNGAPDGIAGGGGAAGMGGALYVDSGNVWLENIAFRYNMAVGGNGSKATIPLEQFSAGGKRETMGWSGDKDCDVELGVNSPFGDAEA